MEGREGNGDSRQCLWMSRISYGHRDPYVRTIRTAYEVSVLRSTYRTLPKPLADAVESIPSVRTFAYFPKFEAKHKL